MKTQAERYMFDEYQAALKRIAEGNAPSLALRTMALRALKGDEVRALGLNAIEPDSTELAELTRMHARAALVLRLH
jgi:hypothetical protein